MGRDYMLMRRMRKSWWGRCWYDSGEWCLWVHCVGVDYYLKG
jgi:hypothetical protein